ncbi:hypothetical protein [Aestuariibaculum marinum]|uniref:Uncharacterized protein n=1 Tax=Aestuariibaculum marinum TaxID=2683592 RepID=A0A8J6PQN7_9FLAO|nr:hypothetical protein [Aestuariibaculum marinum]MBD0822652.1 hypothetical protein [Aestuariibaculum marinum]
MYSIDTIPMINYGLHISKQDGQVHLMDPKEEFYTAYGKQGYQITKHKDNKLDLVGFIMAADLADFKTKVSGLYDVFKSSGQRSIELEADPINCFAENGFSITGVYVFSNVVYARFQISLTIVQWQY